MIIFNSKDDDPVKGCDVYKELGCAHVDGCLCDFPQCSMLVKYLEDKPLESE